MKEYVLLILLSLYSYLGPGGNPTGEPRTIYQIEKNINKPPRPPKAASRKNAESLNNKRGAGRGGRGRGRLMPLLNRYRAQKRQASFLDDDLGSQSDTDYNPQEKVDQDAQFARVGRRNKRKKKSGG